MLFTESTQCSFFRFLLCFIFMGSFLMLSGSSYANSDYYTEKRVITAKVYTSELAAESALDITRWNATPADEILVTTERIATDYQVYTIELMSDDCQILQFSGQLGAGRVQVCPQELEDTLFVHYPVIETIVFLHTNDHHFDINLQDELEKKINEIRGSYSDVFLFDAGDIFVRHPRRWVVNDTLEKDVEWYGQRSMEMVESMNALGYQAMTLGNHELDYVESFTGRALDAAKFPLLSANMEITTDALPSPQSHLHFSTNTGRTISVMGLSVASGNKHGILQKDIFETAAQYMYLREEADVFVALTHIGLQNDARLAEEFPLLDIIIGGHSHHLIEEAVLVNDVLVAQAGGNRHEVSDQHPVYLGKITVKMKNGQITHKEGYVIFIGDE
ncbi:MAG: hypothetical protein EA361_06200 [Bacteroidetes bacterium]|nr:MAG: hypothetical protein EA361_06200 [Bacteroidota bacterium]